MATLDFSQPKTLVNNLVFMHQLMVASERLLKEAADETSGDLKDYYLQHLEEERGHSSWLSHDLRSAGVYTDTLPPLRQAVVIAGSQYYLIKHVHAASLLGYMAVLEGNPPAMEFVEQMEQLHGKPLCRTLRYHAQHDLEHRKALFSMIDASGHPSIMANAIQTASDLSHAMEEFS